MFNWLYGQHTLVIAVVVVGTTVGVAIGGFEFARRKWLHRFEYGEDTNDAISGVLGAIGVFYGITVGLIAIDVWQRHAQAEGIVAREAAAVLTLYLTVRSDVNIGRSVIPDHAEDVVVFKDTDLGDPQKPVAQLLREYVFEVICVSWEKQKQPKNGEKPEDWRKLRNLRIKLQGFEPEHEGQKIRYAAAIRAMNDLSELHRLRTDAVDDQLSWRMWTIILFGAMMSMCVVYLFRLDDVVLHRWMVGLLSGFLGFVILMIVLNNRPFFGSAGLEPDSFLDLHWMLNRPTAATGNANRTRQERPDREKLCSQRP